MSATPRGTSAGTSYFKLPVTITRSAGAPRARSRPAVASDCAQTFPRTLLLTTDWVRYDIPFDELLSSLDRFPIPRDQIYSVGFIVNAGVTFDVWIDDISWIPAP